MDSAGITSLVVVSVLLTTVVCQQSQFVVPNPVTAATPFTVYCDASRAQIPDDVTAINTLQITRNVSANPSDVEVAFYNANPALGFPPTASHIPSGRAWNITFTGSNTIGNDQKLANRDTMKIVWEVQDTTCEDAGRYICAVEYILPDGSSKATSGVVDVTAIAETTAINIAVDPDVTNRQYVVGNNVTFTCNLKCPNTRTIAWQLMVIKDNNVVPTPLPTDSAVIFDSPYGPPDLTSGCPVYDLQSTLTVLITNYDEDEAYICIVSDNSRELERDNITITIAPKPTDKATSIAGPDVSMIVGIIVACFVLFSNDHIRFPMLHAL